MLPTGAIFELKIHQHAFRPGPQALGSLQRSPRPPIAGFQGLMRGRGGEEKWEGRGGKGKEKEGEGESSPLLFTI